MRHSTALPAALLAALLAGCAAYTPRLDSAAKLGTDEAAVYGRFHVDTPASLLALDGHASLGFGMTCSDGSSYLLRFHNSQPVHVIRVKPATCSVNEMVFSDVDGKVRGRKPFLGQAMQKMEFKGGQAHYLGDFFAVAGTQATGLRVHSSWRVRDFKQDYDKTTAEMRTAYPGIAALPTVDLSLMAPGSVPTSN